MKADLPLPAQVAPSEPILTEEVKITDWEREHKIAKKRLLESGNVVGYLDRFDGHKRQCALFEVQKRLSNRQYWKVLRDVWSIEEVTFPHRRKWLKLFRADRPYRSSLMTTAEHKRLAALPEEFPVFRGVGNCRHLAGMSWTLSRAKAEFFANYALGFRRAHLCLPGLLPILVSGRCKKRDVLAVFLDRKEDEIVIPGGLVSGKTIDIVKYVRDPGYAAAA